MIICASCLAACILSIDAYAQSSNAASQTTVSIPPLMTQGPVPGGIIRGYVLDENGNTVPGVTVTLRMNGQLWQPDNYDLNNCGNPQTTNLANSRKYGYLNEGSFEFGYLYPGDYLINVENDEYKGSSAIIHLSNDTMRPSLLNPEPPATNINITLIGYHRPTLTPEQLAYTGSISGVIRSAYGPGIENVNVSLWQNGRMLNTPDNPQSSLRRTYLGKDVDYLFEHVAPGQYTIRADYDNPSQYYDTISVDVGKDAVTAEILLSHVMPSRPSSAPTTSVSSATPAQVTNSATPSNPTVTLPPGGTISPSPSRMATPALPALIVLFVIGFVMYYKMKK